MFPKRTSRFLIAAPATLIMLAGLAGCAQESARIDLTSYAPVIDVKGQGYDMADYQQDLNECRMLGVRVQAAYEAQQKKEREADNAKERSTRRAVQTYTSAESHADGEALHLNRALLARCSATFAQRPRCLRPS